VLAAAPEADRRRFHFFNSFFFKKLSEKSSEPAGRPTRAQKARAAHERVKTWTKVRLGMAAWGAHRMQAAHVLPKCRTWQAAGAGRCAMPLEQQHWTGCCVGWTSACVQLPAPPCCAPRPALPQGVDIFSKDFLLVPIHDALHWSLAIICHPALISQQIEQRMQQQQQLPAAEAAGAAALVRAAGGGTAATAAPAADSAAAAAGGEAIRAQPVIIHLDSMQGEPVGWHRLVADPMIQ
jgi:Ulp1 family protease